VNPEPPLRRNIVVLSVALLLVLILLPLAAQAGNPTQTTVTAVPQSPSEYLQLVTFTAMVTGSVAPPTGTVTFTDSDGFRLCVLPVQLVVAGCGSNCSTAACSTATLPVGANTVTAAYSGDSNNNPSGGSIPYTVNGNTPTTTLFVSPASPVAGQVVTLTATVSNGGDPVTSGTVTFSNSNNSEVLATVQLVSQSGPALGTAILKTRFAPGNYPVLANFNGTFGNQPSGAAANFTVTGTEPTITTLTDQADGNNWDFTATVFGFGFPAPTGMASFTDLTTMVNLGSAGVAGPGVSSFQLPAPSYPVGDVPALVAVGDFKGDGIADLAIVNQCGNGPPPCDSNTGTVSVLLGDGMGHFSAAPGMPPTVGVVPYGIAVGDFNGDGSLDLAVVNECGNDPMCESDGTVSVLLGDGMGNFSAALGMPPTTGAAPSGIAVADFNSDGVADLAVTNEGDNTVSVFLGDGMGNFSAARGMPPTVGAEPFAVAVADFNGDGIADLVVTNYGDGTVSVLLGNGDGTFSAAPGMPPAVGVQPYGVAVADFNGDGFADLAVANGGSNTVSVLLGNGNGTFQAQRTYTVGAQPIEIAVADFNGDGKTDLGVTNENDSTVIVLLGDGTGNFSPAPGPPYTVGVDPFGIAAADFNGDGVPDLASANQSANNTSILLGGTVTSAQILNIPVIGSGMHMIQSTYTPNPGFYTGGPSNIVSVAATLLPTTTTLTSSVNPSQLNQPVTFTATVTANGGGMPTGTVSFSSDNGFIPECPYPVNLVNGQATCTTSSQPLGMNIIVAQYSGDQNFASSQGNLNQVVNQASGTATTLNVAPNPATAGQVVTLTATVTSSSEPVLVGTVNFLSGTQVLATVQMVQVAGQGTATLKIRFAPGVFQLNAQYNANDLYQASQSGPQQLTVTGTESTITTLTDQANGTNWNFTATVFGFGFPAATGMASFTDLTTQTNLGSAGLAGLGMSSFQPQRTDGVGVNPVGVAVGDFNGDGITDLAAANQGSNTISVLLGDGLGNFTPAPGSPFTVGSEPNFIAVADFNGDGFVDLAVTNFGGNTVSVLLGNGTGGFSPASGSPFTVGRAPTGIAVGDFNGDGIADLAVTNQSDSTVSVLLGDGMGDFSAAPGMPPRTGLTPSGIVVADFNGDGIADLAVTNNENSDSSVSVFLGNGDGTFQPAQIYFVGVSPYGIAVADFNGDGFADLAVVNECGTDPSCLSPGTVSVLLGTADGIFQNHATYTVGMMPAGIVIADFNGDGKADLAVTNENDGTVSVLLGDGMGNFSPAPGPPDTVGANPIGIAAADFNGDGVPDLATANEFANSASILLGGTVISGQILNVPVIGSGMHMIQSTYTPNQGFYTGSLSNMVSVAAMLLPTTTTVTSSVNPSQLNQQVTFTATVTSSGGGMPTGTVNFTDNGAALCTAVPLGNGGQAQCTTSALTAGMHAIAAVYSGDQNFASSQGNLNQMVNQASGTTTTLTVAPNPATAGQVVTLTATVTSNGEPVPVGMLSFLRGNQVLATVQMVQTAGQSTATLKTRFGPGVFQLTAHYNANDFFQASQSGPQQLTVTGTESTITTLTDQANGTNWNFTATVFGFGFPAATGMASFTDLTTQANLGSAGLAGPGMSTFQPQQTYQVGEDPINIAVSDFNGDGIPDLAVTNSDGTENTVSVLLGNGNGTFQPQQTYPVGLQPEGIAVADFNGDGIPDLAITNQSDSTVSVLLGNGNGTFQPQQTYPTGANPNGIAVADFNGDGVADLAVANLFGNTVSVLLGNGNGTFQPQQTDGVGANPVGVAVADFNGDGIPDLAVTNESDNTVSVLLGNGDGTFQPQQTYPVGLQPFGIAAGDFKGDGIADLVIVNECGNDPNCQSAGTVSVLLGNGDGTFQPQQTYPVGLQPFGVAVADFNGDGIPDLAITNEGDITVGVLLGNGNGTFQPQQTYQVGQVPLGIAAADLNGDGVPDVAVVNTVDTTVGVLLGGSVVSGQIQNVPVIGPGIHMVQSTYTPNQGFYTGSLSNIVNVNGSGTKVTPPVTLTASPQEINQGNSVFFSVTVGSSAGVVPTGTVTFIDGRTPLATVTLDPGGDANYSNATLVVGQHSITAMYSGDSNFNSATSAAVTVQVDNPFILQSTSYSGSVSPGGQTQFQINVIAAYQSNPLVYAALTCTPPAGSGITCSVTCPHTSPAPCTLESDSEQATVTINTSSGITRLAPPLHRGGHRVIAAFAGLSGIGLVGLVFIPMRSRRRAAIGILFLVIVVLCYGTSCGGNFAPGTSSSPANNTFYISVNAELREELGNDPAKFNSLGVQKFWYTLLIK